MMVKDTAETKDYLTFELNGVTYLPHYQNSKLFVGPGYPRLNKKLYTADDFLKAGAKGRTTQLWHRAEHVTILGI